jgi:plastocyanin
VPARLLLAALLVLSAGCGSDDAADDKGAPSSQPSATGDSAGGTSLSIASFSYNPNPLTVAPGATITVSNVDSATHTVTSETKGLFDVTAEKGSPVTLTAPKAPGSYAFICTVHPSMKGTLVVSG